MDETHCPSCLRWVTPAQFEQRGMTTMHVCPHCGWWLDEAPKEETA